MMRARILLDISDMWDVCIWHLCSLCAQLSVAHSSFSRSQIAWADRIMLTTRSLFLFTIFTVLFTCQGDSTEGTGVAHAPPGDVAVLAAPGSEASEKAGDSENSHPAAPAASAAPVAPQLRSGWGHGRHPGSWSPTNNRRPVPKPLKNHAMGPRRWWPPRFHRWPPMPRAESARFTSGRKMWTVGIAIAESLAGGWLVVSHGLLDCIMTLLAFYWLIVLLKIGLLDGSGWKHQPDATFQFVCQHLPIPLIRLIFV